MTNDDDRELFETFDLPDSPGEESSDSDDSLTPPDPNDPPEEDEAPVNLRFGERITAIDLFIQRMEREGRRPELDEIIRRLFKETEKEKTSSNPNSRKPNALILRNRAVKEMGYLGSKHEKMLHEYYLKGEEVPEEIEEELIQKHDQKTLQESLAVLGEEFEEALLSLPTTADPESEYLWLRNHPAIIRTEIDQNPSKKSIIRIEDINGDGKYRQSAPSRHVAILLVRFVNNYNQFLKWEEKTQAVIQKLKSERTAKAGFGETYIDDLSELERMIALAEPDESATAEAR